MKTKNTKPGRLSDNTRGGQVLTNNFYLWLQVTKTKLWLTIICLALFSGIFFYYFGATESFKPTMIYLWAWFLNKASFFNKDLVNHALHFTINGADHSSAVRNILVKPDFIYHKNQFWMSIFTQGACALIAALWALFGLHRWASREGKKHREERFLRGMELATPKELTQTLKSKNTLSDLKISSYHIIKHNFEVQHILADGTTGSGKSNLIRNILDWIQGRGDKVFIFDKGGTYTARYYDKEKDHLLNPFDARSVNWDVWADGQSITDLENMAAALIPQHGEGDPFWVNSARTIFADSCFKMKDKANRSLAELLEVMLTSKINKLDELLEGTSSASLVSSKIEKTAISIKSVLATYIKALRFLEGLDIDAKTKAKKPAFSIKAWVANENDKGWLFLSSNAQQHASLRPLISMWVAIASIALLGLPENENRRLWFILDEMPTLHRLPELPETIAEVRKFGGCYLIGIQSFAQLQKIYGSNAAKEMFDLLNTRFFFRSPSEEMAAITSKELGEQEIEVSRDNRSIGVNAIRDGMTFGFQEKTRRLVLPAEIMKLDDLSCYVRNAGEYPITKIQMEYHNKKPITQGFINREIELSERMQYVQALLAHYQLGELNKLPENLRKQHLRMQQENLTNDAEKSNDMQERETMKESVDTYKQSADEKSGDDSGDNHASENGKPTPAKATTNKNKPPKATPKQNNTSPKKPKKSQSESTTQTESDNTEAPQKTMEKAEAKSNQEKPDKAKHKKDTDAKKSVKQPEDEASAEKGNNKITPDHGDITQDIAESKDMELDNFSF